jgi:predicted XRE-type DNA-binding protein
MVSQSNSAGRAEVRGASEEPWPVYDLNDSLADPEFREIWNSEESRAHWDELVAAHQLYRLKLLRKSLGLNQTELAKRLGVSQIRVSQIEKGQISKFEVGTLKRYVEALGGELSITVRVGDKQLELLDITPDTLEVWGD